MEPSIERGSHTPISMQMLRKNASAKKPSENVELQDKRPQKATMNHCAQQPGRANPCVPAPEALAELPPQAKSPPMFHSDVHRGTSSPYLKTTTPEKPRTQ
ncbi:hypothetical protein CR513_08874, partial [Mucuna pruriens]